MATNKKSGKGVKTPKTTGKNSNNKNAMVAVSSSIDFIKSQIANDLIKAKNAGMINLEMTELKKITSVVETSIGQSFVKSSTSLINTLNKSE